MSVVTRGTSTLHCIGSQAYAVFHYKWRVEFLLQVFLQVALCQFSSKCIHATWLSRTPLCIELIVDIRKRTTAPHCTLVLTTITTAGPDTGLLSRRVTPRKMKTKISAHKMLLISMNRRVNLDRKTWYVGDAVADTKITASRHCRQTNSWITTRNYPHAIIHVTRFHANYYLCSSSRHAF